MICSHAFHYKHLFKNLCSNLNVALPIKCSCICKYFSVYICNSEKTNIRRTISIVSHKLVLNFLFLNAAGVQILNFSAMVVNCISSIKSHNTTNNIITAYSQILNSLCPKTELFQNSEKEATELYKNNFTPMLQTIVTNRMAKS